MGYNFFMQEIVQNVITSLKTAFNSSFDDFEGMYLYGSQARGDFHKDSDIDIVAVFKAENKEKRRIIWRIVSKIEYDFGVNIDLHPMTKEDLEKNTIFHKQVVEKGLFYDAA